MPEERTILFVSAATGDALRAAKRLGLRVVVLTDMELTWQRQYVDHQLAVCPYRPEEAFDAAAAFNLRHKLDGLATFDERAVPVAALIGGKLGLKGNSYEAAYAARNKFIMRSRLSEGGIACPRFGIAHTAGEAERLARDSIKYPLVLKPLFGFGSQGVLRVDGPEQLSRAFPLIQGIAASHGHFVGDDPYRDCLLLEEFLSGREVAVDGILQHGRAHWFGMFDKPNPLEGPTFEETIYVTPSSEDGRLQAEIFAEVERGALALGLQTGPIHAEVRIDGDRLRLIEIGARAIGGICARAYTYCLGEDYCEYVIRNALGESFEFKGGERVPAGVMMLPVPNPGRLVGVDGVEEARSVEGVRDVFIMAKPGDLLRGFPEQGCYIGFITASGPSTREVEEALNKSHSLLRFQLDPLPLNSKA
jgi:biotin carboxylase